MDATEIRRLIRKEIQLQMNVILSGQAANASNITEDIQALFPGGTGIVARPVMHPYGFCSLAPDGTIQVVARQGEHFANRVVLGHRAADRPTDLESGESVQYSVGGYQVRVQNGAIMIGKDGVYETMVVGNTLVVFLTALLQELAIHTHAAPGAPPTDAEAFTEMKTQYLDSNGILAEDNGRF
jgi:phage gp45-like